MPLPNLESSCERFLAWCAPLLSPDELTETQEAVETFLRPESPAHKLQADLERFNASETTHSWLDTFWDYRYLGRRDRIALSANYFFLFKGSGLGQVRRAAELASAAVGYKLRLNAQSVPPTVRRGHMLSMEQTSYLFSTTRVPGDVQDTVRLAPSEDGSDRPPERHVTVFFRGIMFRLDVLDSSGRPYSCDELDAGLRAVAATAEARAEPGTSVGHLTTMSRAEWAEARQELRELHPRNAELLDWIETALFCICLDDFNPEGTLQKCEHLLHGDSGNRWFDKSISFVVFADGTSGISVEHSRLDGTTVADFVDSLLDEPADEHARRIETEPMRIPAFAPINFVLNSAMQAEVQRAARSFRKFASTSTSSVLSLDVGSDVAKHLQISPDGFIQIAFHLAHHRVRKCIGTTYESISTRHYHHGRSEAMRTVTPESIRFEVAMDGHQSSETVRRTALRDAVHSHVQRARECQAGRAPEQHLWELQRIHQREYEDRTRPAPLALFESPGWLKMRDDYLSTSSVSCRNIEYFGFGPTNARCIGVAYLLLSDRLNVHLSAPRPVRDEMIRFAFELQVAVDQLQALLAPEHM